MMRKDENSAPVPIRSAEELFQLKKKEIAANSQVEKTKMPNFFGLLIVGLAIFHGQASAQFNVLPVFIAESVINEHKEGDTVKVETTSTTEEHPRVEVPLHPKLVAALSDHNSIQTSDKLIERVKRDESPFTKTQIKVDQRGFGRQADIDSFLTELERDISKSQPTRYNSKPLNQAPSWSYKPAATTEKSFWKKWGESIGSTYEQAKSKTKDIVKGFKL